MKFDYLGTYDTLEELLEAVNKIPSNIDYISVQSNLCHFQPTNKKLRYTIDLQDRVKEIIDSALEEETENDKINRFILRSYYGGLENNDSLNISLSSDAAKKFASDMSSGKYGRLD